MGVFSFSGVLAVVLGIGFLIFIHELGHFLVAKLVGIRVLGFSIGFGPRVIGFRRGETDYRLSLFPFGGYVRMAGESPEDGAVVDGGDFRSKSVGQRTAVISAGVVMNAIFAFILFAIAFTLGVPFEAPVIGEVRPGSPAWRADVPEGARILEVNGNRVFDFADVAVEVAISKKDAGVLLTLEEEGEQPRDVLVTPRRNPDSGLFEIGISSRRERLVVEEDHHAYEQGLRSGDVVVAVDGEPIDSPSELFEQIARWRLPVGSSEQPSFELRVRGPAGDRVVSYRPQWARDRVIHQLGIHVIANRVLGARERSSLPEGVRLEEGDSILRMNDEPVYLPEQFAGALQSAASGEVSVLVQRGEERDLQRWQVDNPSRLLEQIALGPAIDGTTLFVYPDSPAADAGLRSGDRITSLDGLSMEEFSDIRDFMGEYEGDDPIDVVYERDGETGSLSVLPGRYHPPKLDLLLDIDLETVRADNLMEACSIGFARTIHSMKQIVVMLERMLVRRTIPTDKMGGIVLIAYVSYKFAAFGLAKVLFFLGLLSVNLAIINLLPIPVLDGGQLVFLLIEKIKGSPVSEKAQQIAVLTGMAAIILLVIYVTYNDIDRLF